MKAKIAALALLACIVGPAVAQATPTLVGIESDGSGVDGTSFETGSHTIHGGALVLFTIWGVVAAGTPAITSVAGHSCSWELVAVQDSTTRSQSMYRCTIPTDHTGTITVTYTASVARVTWSVAEATGADTTGTGCAGGIVQCPKGTDNDGLDLVATLAAYGSSDNRPYVVGTSNTGSATATGSVVESGWTELLDAQNTEAGRMLSAWRDNTDDTTLTMTWDAGGSANKIWIAVEIAPAATTVASADRILGGGIGSRGMID